MKDFDNKKVLFINPSADCGSGLSRYYQNFSSELESRGVLAEIIQRNKNESISCFKSRLGCDLDENFTSKFDIIEIPHSYGLLNDVECSCPVHVRLHGSNSLLSELSSRRKKY